MKLKTLNDLLEAYWKIGDTKEIKIAETLKKDIKQEAIKWVKDKCPRTPDCERCIGAIKMFKHFFNITEEDLK